MRVEIFTLGHASSLYYYNNNKLSRLDACPSATRELGQKFQHAFLGCL